MSEEKEVTNNPIKNSESITDELKPDQKAFTKNDEKVFKTQLIQVNQPNEMVRIN